MKKIIIEGGIAGLLLLSGLGFLISRFTRLTDKDSTIPLVSGLVLILIGLVLLLMTLRTLMTYLSKQKKEEEALDTVVVASNRLIERNNDIVNDWDKTNEARDRLKLLKMASDSDA